MEVVRYMTPEGLEEYLLLDGAPVRLEDVRETLSSEPASLLSTTKDSRRRLFLEYPNIELINRSSHILLVVPACCARHARKK